MTSKLLKFQRMFSPIVERHGIMHHYHRCLISSSTIIAVFLVIAIVISKKIIIINAIGVSNLSSPLLSTVRWGGGGVYGEDVGVLTPPLDEMTCGFLIYTTGILY